ncbi:NAD(P)H-dependent oxidoreductase subunit E [Acidaminobacter sp. JC074]|uniref:NADH-quinone oxidoreductase subunit NuoE family protein n=1 Tax=Acidaminobacter sp. JC074 TaxID=2530199 RepID=UPI001F0E63D2|nr:NAD(P)H-dependent oxidoreductase subunit E [Acidaminobacter sp. JC074]MCH4890038.1 NAD(P)H-dependent oxidoreductase subunit E [Acidaminobacter sp. JC074]
MGNTVIDIIEGIGKSEDKLLEILIEIQNQETYNYLSKSNIEEVSRYLDISVTKIYGIAEFYSMLSTVKRGKHIIRLCNSTPCYLEDGMHVKKIFEDILGIGVGQTTEDGMFSLEYCSCLGACDQAPAVQIDDAIYGRLDRNKIFDLISTIRRRDLDE